MDPRAPISQPTRSAPRVFTAALLLATPFVLAACGDDLLRRRVDVDQAQGADADLEQRFGITSDAQDPTERQKDLGYGRWKQAPETEGTPDPTSYKRRSIVDD